MSQIIPIGQWGELELLLQGDAIPRSAPGSWAPVSERGDAPPTKASPGLRPNLQVGQAAVVTQPHELVGTFVVEVGERQAWPFMTFCDNDTTPSREARLYIDTELTVNGSNAWLSAAELPTARLFPLNSLGVTAVNAGDAELSIAFDDGSQMIVSGVASAWTSGDVWWLGPWTS